MADEESPIFVSGRQYSGNTMLSRMLGRHDELHAFTGEGAFFEKLPEIKSATGEKLKRRVAQEIGGGSLDVNEVLKHIRRHVGENDPSPLDCYRAAKNGIARQHGVGRWVQKATSYVFYVPKILRHFPEARFLFLARNPLDLAASWKRRGHKAWWGRMLWGWNQGIRRAQLLKERHPENFKVVLYEDLVTNPTDIFREVCSFCGIWYQESCVQVPHVNRSETPYNQDSETTGIKSDRVFYFSNVLTPTEAAVVRQLADAEALHTFYPDLPTIPETSRLRQASELMRIVGAGGIRLFRKQAGELLAKPVHTWDRIKRRVT